MNSQQSRSALRRHGKKRCIFGWNASPDFNIVVFETSNFLQLNPPAEIFFGQVLLEKFQTASFAELCSITMANKPAESLYHCLNDIYGRSTYSDASSVSRKSSLSIDTTDVMTPQKTQKPMYEEYFPELFMY